MSSARSFVFKLRAQYDGNNAFASLSSDLKSIGKMKSLSTLNKQFSSVTEKIRGAEQEIARLKKGMQAPGGEKLAKGLAAAEASLAGYISNQEKLVKEADTAREVLKKQGINLGNIAGEYRRLKRESKEYAKDLAAMNKLGVRSFSDIKSEIAGLQKAYARVKGKATFAEQIVYADRLKRKVAALKGEMNGWSGALGRIKDGWAGMLTVAASMRLGGSMVSEFAEFSDAMLKVKAISGATEEEFAALEKQAQKLGATTRYTATEADEGMSQLAAAGMNAAEVAGTIAAALDIAAVSGVGVGESADQLTNIMAQFNLKTEDAAHVGDVLAKGFTGAATTLDQLAEALTYVGPLAKSFGYSLEDTVTVLQAYANAGYKGERGGTIGYPAILCGMFLHRHQLRGA